MRQLFAITTPQEIVNNCFQSIELMTKQRALPILPGAELDHVALVVSPEAFDQLTEPFADLIDGRATLSVPEAGRGAIGVQTQSSDISWYWGNIVPALALVENCRNFSVPAGGAYAVARYPSIRQAGDALRRLDIVHQQTTLYGEPALQVIGESTAWSVAQDPYSLFLTGRTMPYTAPAA